MADSKDLIIEDYINKIEYKPYNMGNEYDFNTHHFNRNKELSKYDNYYIGINYKIDLISKLATFYINYNQKNLNVYKPSNSYDRSKISSVFINHDLNIQIETASKYVVDLFHTEGDQVLNRMILTEVKKSGKCIKFIYSNAQYISDHYFNKIQALMNSYSPKVVFIFERISDNIFLLNMNIGRALKKEYSSDSQYELYRGLDRQQKIANLNKYMVYSIRDFYKAGKLFSELDNELFLFAEYYIKSNSMNGNSLFADYITSVRLASAECNYDGYITFYYYGILDERIKTDYRYKKLKYSGNNAILAINVTIHISCFSVNKNSILPLMWTEPPYIMMYLEELDSYKFQHLPSNTGSIYISRKHFLTTADFDEL